MPGSRFRRGALTGVTGCSKGARENASKQEENRCLYRQQNHDKRCDLVTHVYPALIPSSTVLLAIAITEWATTVWPKTGWTTTKGKPVKHQDVIKYILAMVEVCKLSDQRFVMLHVKDPRADRGPYVASNLARAGMLRPEISHWDWDRLREDQEHILACLGGIDVGVSEALFSKLRGFLLNVCRVRF
jgi:hypothetical protein